MRDEPAAQGARHPGRRRARLRRQGPQLSGSAGDRRDGQGSRRSTTGCGASSASTDPLTWPSTFTWIAWRLHVPAAVPDLTARAQSSKLSLADRRLALDTLAFVNDPAASKAMLDARAAGQPVREPATVWLLNRMSNDWTDHNLGPALKAAGIYDPDTIDAARVVVPRPAADTAGALG